MHFRGRVWYNNSVMKKILLVLIGGIFTLTTFAADENPAADYVVIAPKNYVELWTWYIGERQKAHPEITFAVKSAADIYNEYPYDAANTDGSPRNAAESIHKYIRETAKTDGTKYFVLGGVWFDARHPEESGSLATGETIDINNAIPGIRAFPVNASEIDERYGTMHITNYPSDLFYACHYIDPDATSKYPWDPNGDGVYCTKGELNKKEYLEPSVVVARMDFVPCDAWKDENGNKLNYEQLVRKYVGKLARGEAKDFAGRDKYVSNVNYLLSYDQEGWPDAMGIMQARLDSIRAYRSVKELYMAACKNDSSNLPEIIGKTMSGDWEVSLPFGHGIPEVCAYIVEEDFCKQTGLIRFFMANIPCYTGTVTSFSREDGLLPAIAQLSLSNPSGGSLVSINNTYTGQCTDWTTTKRYRGISDELLDYTLDAYVRDGKTAGEAWKDAISTYVGIIYGENQEEEVEKRSCNIEEHLHYIQSAIIEEILFGDPLIKLSPLHIAPRIIVK